MTNYSKLAFATLSLFVCSSSINAAPEVPEVTDYLIWSWSFGEAPTNVGPTDTVYIPATVSNSSASLDTFFLGSIGGGSPSLYQYRFDLGRDLTFPWAGLTEQWSGMQSLAPGESFSFTFATLTPYSSVYPGTYGIGDSFDIGFGPGADMCTTSPYTCQAPTNDFLFTVLGEPAPAGTKVRDAEFFGPKSSKDPLPLGELKIWDKSSGTYVLLESARGQQIFDPKKSSEVLVHGWNGEFENNTPLEDKWIVSGGFTQALAENPRVDSNILAFDWKEAANSRKTSVANLVRDELGLSEDEYSKLAFAEATNSALSPQYSYLSSLYGSVTPTVQKWNEVLGDKWVPNQQIARQGAELANQLKDHLRLDGAGTVAFYGHSLGAGVSTYAVQSLIGLGLGDSVERLTIFDPPERGLSGLTDGMVGLPSELKLIKESLPRLPIDNYWSSAPVIGFGKPYSYAANIQTEDLGHGRVPAPLYVSTIDYNTDPANLVSGSSGGFISFESPEGIGYDDETGSITLARQGTNCAVMGAYGSGGRYNPFAYGLEKCKSDGFVAVFDEKITKTKLTVDFKAFLGSEEAVVEIDPMTGLPTLTTGSSVYAYTDFFIPKNALGIEIDLDWINGFFNDDFMVWINETLVFSIGFNDFQENFSTGIIGLSSWKDQIATLTLGVLSDYDGSTISVRDIRLVYAEVPEPKTLALLFVGIFCLWISRNAGNARARVNPCH